MSARPHSGQLVARLERPTTTEPTRLAIVSDIHLATEGSGTWKVFHRSERHFRAAVDRVNDLAVDGVVIPGDLTRNGRPEEYERFDELAQFDAPTVAIPGNHDLNTSYDSHEPMSPDQFARTYTPGSLPFRTTIGGLEIIGLNSHGATPGEPPASYAGELSTESLEWLEETLTDGDTDNTILTVHHNLPAMTALYERYRSALPMQGMVPGFENPEPLVELLGAYNVPLTITGHLHFPALVDMDGVRELTVPAVSSFPHAILLAEIDQEGTTIWQLPLTDDAGLVESIAHGYEKDRVLLAAAQVARMPFCTEWE